MKSIAASALIVSLAACFSVAARATPTLVGDTIDASVNFTAASTSGAHRITGYGLDHPFIVSSSASDLKTFSNIFTLDVNGGSFALDFLRTGQVLNGVVFKLTGLDFSSGATLASVGIKSNLSGYSVISSAHEIDIDFSNVYFDCNSYLNGTFVLGNSTVAAVPEPSTWALAALGLGGLGVVARRRRAR